MLKLGHGLNVTLREKERFFEKSLLIALGCALAFHLGALLLFHVIPFTFASSYVFPPVQVRSIQTVPGTSAWANAPHEEDELRPPTPSFIPLLEIASLETKPLHLKIDALEAIEEDVWPIALEPLALDLSQPRIRLNISGPLAEHRLVKSDPALEEKLQLSLKTTPVFVRYQVRMHEQTGELYWLERTESSGKPSIDQLTQKIAFHLRFEPTTSLDALEGTLTFAILLPDET